MVDQNDRPAEGRPEDASRMPQEPQRNLNDMTEEERQREAERADEAWRRHGAEQARRAAAVINQPLAPPITALSACEMARKEGERSILMNVPRNIVLTLDFRNGPFKRFWGNRLAIPAGPQELPETVAGHWWVRAHGAEPYRGPGQRPSSGERTYTQAEVDAMMAARLRGADVVRPERPTNIDPSLEIERGQGGELGGRGTLLEQGRSNEYGGSGDQSRPAEESRPDFQARNLEEQQRRNSAIGPQAEAERASRQPQHNPDIFQQQQRQQLEESGEAERRREGQKQEQEARGQQPNKGERKGRN